MPQLNENTRIEGMTIADLYEKVKGLIKERAYHFSKGVNNDVSEFQSFGNYIFMRAVCAWINTEGITEKRRKFSAFLHWRLERQFINYKYRLKEQFAVDVTNELFNTAEADSSSPYTKVAYQDALKCLSSESKQIVKIMLKCPHEFMNRNSSELTSKKKEVNWKEILEKNGMKFKNEATQAHVDNLIDEIRYIFLGKRKKENSKRTMIISEFKNEYRFLSNFWPCQIEMNEKIYPSVEHAYQASKTLLEQEREMIRNLPTPGEAKRKGRLVTLRSDWSDELKISIMTKLSEQKYKNQELKDLLLGTGSYLLIEGNRWGDDFWGKIIKGDRMVGRNHLGKILMELRTKLSK